MGWRFAQRTRRHTSPLHACGSLINFGIRQNLFFFSFCFYFIEWTATFTLIESHMTAHTQKLLRTTHQTLLSASIIFFAAIIISTHTQRSHGYVYWQKKNISDYSEKRMSANATYSYQFIDACLCARSSLNCPIGFNSLETGWVGASHHYIRFVHSHELDGIGHSRRNVWKNTNYWISMRSIHSLTLTHLLTVSDEYTNCIEPVCYRLLLRLNVKCHTIFASQLAHRAIFNWDHLPLVTFICRPMSFVKIEKWRTNKDTGGEKGERESIQSWKGTLNKSIVRVSCQLNKNSPWTFCFFPF